MSNSFVAIAQRMDELQAKISSKDAETKDFADKAVASHAERLDLEQQLTDTRLELSGALGAITAFLGSLTVLPDLVTKADEIADAEATAAAAAEEAANTPVVEEPAPEVPSTPVDAAADPVAAAAELAVPGTAPVDAPEVVPKPVTPSPAPVATEQPVTFEEPVATDLGLPGSDTLGLPAVTEPAPEQPIEEPETLTVAEPAPGDPEMVDDQPTLPDMPTPASDEAPLVTEPATEPAAPETSTESLGAEATETGSDPVVAEPDAPAEPTGELDPLTGLPKPQL